MTRSCSRSPSIKSRLYESSEYEKVNIRKAKQTNQTGKPVKYLTRHTEQRTCHAREHLLLDVLGHWLDNRVQLVIFHVEQPEEACKHQKTMLESTNLIQGCSQICCSVSRSSGFRLRMPEMRSFASIRLSFRPETQSEEQCKPEERKSGRSNLALMIF